MQITHSSECIPNLNIDQLINMHIDKPENLTPRRREGRLITPSQLELLIDPHLEVSSNRTSIAGEWKSVRNTICKSLIA